MKLLQESTRATKILFPLPHLPPQKRELRELESWFSRYEYFTTVTPVPASSMISLISKGTIYTCGIYTYLLRCVYLCVFRQNTTHINVEN